MAVELTGLVDPAHPLDPAAKRALAARELKRLGPTPGLPGSPTAPVAPDWTDAIRVRFASLENETALEILDCVLDPTYSSSPRPQGAVNRLRVFLETALPGSDLPDRLHATYSCSDGLPGHVSGVSRAGTIWNLTANRVACQRCMNDPAIREASAIVGRDRQRVDIRSNVLRTLEGLRNGSVHWPSVQRLAALGVERWEPRFENGFIDRGNPERWAPDPIAAATVELAVAVGQATGQHLAALWDAAMIQVLAHHASNGSNSRVRRKAGKALAAAIDGHSWEELSGVVADQIDTKLTRLKSVEKRVTAVLAEFEPEIGALVADELDSLEVGSESFTDWSPKLVNENVSDHAVLSSRLIMSWHGGPVPKVVLRSIQTYPS